MGMRWTQAPAKPNSAAAFVGVRFGGVEGDEELDPAGLVALSSPGTWHNPVYLYWTCLPSPLGPHTG